MRQLVVSRMAPGKLGEFLDLVLPGGAEVPVEMGILLQAGVRVGGQHLAVACKQ